MKDSTVSIAHLGIPVSDMEKSCQFYHLLGFQISEQHKLESEGTVTWVTFLKMGSVTLELYCSDSITVADRVGAIDHFAITTRSVEKTMSELGNCKIPVVEGPTILPFGKSGVKYIVIEGPDKEKIEFDEYL